MFLYTISEPVAVFSWKTTASNLLGLDLYICTYIYLTCGSLMAHLKLLHLDHFSGKKLTNTAFPLQQSPAFLFFLPFFSTHPWISFKAKMDIAVHLLPCPFFHLAIICAKSKSECSSHYGIKIRGCDLAVFPPNLHLFQMPKPFSLTKSMTASESYASSWSANHAYRRAWKTLLFSI